MVFYHVLKNVFNFRNCHVNINNEYFIKILCIDNVDRIHEKYIFLQEKYTGHIKCIQNTDWYTI